MSLSLLIILFLTMISPLDGFYGFLIDKRAYIPRVCDVVLGQTNTRKKAGYIGGFPLLRASTDSETIISPFDATKGRAASESDDDADDDEDDELPLTRENVELVLDEMRPYLQSDGGDVKLSEIDGPIVRLELVGACGTCPSSSMTMKMGLERKLKERIPEIAEVVQTLPDAPKLSNENIESVLDGVRPFLSVAGGKISIDSITGVGGLQPVVTLRMEGSAASLQSVKLEIMQRIQRHFMMSLRIEWK